MPVGPTGRRWPGPKPRFLGVPPDHWGPALQKLADALWDDSTEGIPAGFRGTAPNPIQAGATASAGTLGAGWMAADATFAPVTATATDLANANAEGSSTSLTRADHKHKRDVRVQADAADVGTRNRLDFEGMIVEDDAGGDRVEVSPSWVRFFMFGGA